MKRISEFLFTNKILRDIPIQVFNHGNMKRDFTYIDDIITGTRSAIKENYKCEVFNLGNHKSEQLMDVVKLIESNLGKKVEIDFQPMQPGDVPESFSDIDKSVERLGYKPMTNIDVGIEKFIKWYKQYFSDS